MLPWLLFGLVRCRLFIPEGLPVVSIFYRSHDMQSIPLTISSDLFKVEQTLVRVRLLCNYISWHSSATLCVSYPVFSPSRYDVISLARSQARVIPAQQFFCFRSLLVILQVLCYMYWCLLLVHLCHLAVCMHPCVVVLALVTINARLTS